MSPSFTARSGGAFQLVEWLRAVPRILFNIVSHLSAMKVVIVLSVGAPSVILSRLRGDRDTTWKKLAYGWTCVGDSSEVGQASSLSATGWKACPTLRSSDLLQYRDLHGAWAALIRAELKPDTIAHL
jgi:hypothetical protein